MEIYLRFGFDEVHLGSVEEITGPMDESEEEGGIGISFRAAISDIVANMLCPPEEDEANFTITLR